MMLSAGWGKKGFALGQRLAGGVAHIMYKTMLYPISVATSLVSSRNSWSIATLGGLAISMPLAVLHWNQDHLLYMPNFPPGSVGPMRVTPKQYGLPYLDLWIDTIDSKRLHTWLILQPDGRSTKVPTLVYFHGNAGNISHRLPNVDELYRRLNVNILLVSYRGYGQSTGRPSEEGLNLDARAVLSELMQRRDIDTSQIILFGRSLGGAVALSLASSEHVNGKLKAVIVENTFTSVADMIDELYPVLAYGFVKKYLLNNRWESSNAVPVITAPMLFLSGEDDEIVPPVMMRRLSQAAESSALAKLVTFPRGKHNETWLLGGYYDAIAKFLADIRELETK
eukprot:GFYU01009480.1.p1 GENE.GFYU01009480.1~~GFYU01009480.1.p1  ORF type:complete len:338 (-),score=32.19 GFYU01009480.1:163-1176(-)